MDLFPTIAYFAADPKYARDWLPDFHLPGSDSARRPRRRPRPSMEIIMDQETSNIVQQAMVDAHIALGYLTPKEFAKFWNHEEASA